MSIAYIVITVVAAVMVGFSAVVVLIRAKWIVDLLTAYGVPLSWMPWLGAAKAAGAAGLLVGLAWPPIGVLAAIGVILYFIGAVIVVARARWFTHIPYPFFYLAPAAASLALRLLI